MLRVGADGRTRFYAIRMGKKIKVIRSTVTTTIATWDVGVPLSFFVDSCCVISLMVRRSPEGLTA